MFRPRLSRVPSAVVELLRLFVVVFFAALGSLVTVRWDFSETPWANFDGGWIGVIVGSGLGYVLGGVLGRSTVAAVDRTEQNLRSVSAETIVGGVFGGVVGVLLAAAVAWPVFFLSSPVLGLPLFGFVLVTVGLLGFRIGAGK
ncbi:MAG TPA: hypothetical protein VMT27_06395, partial [Actinomycetes bacterium]|nr:hypothetical protein [Actinomycetes bacterium]